MWRLLKRQDSLNKQQFSLSEFDDTIRTVLDSGGEFRIYPQGNSMLPLLREGRDSVVLEKPSGRLKQGDITLYQRENGAYILHRVIKAEGSFAMCGDNQLTVENGIRQEQIIGVVTRIYRDDKLLSEKNILYRYYLVLWRSFFLRRIYFRLRRMLGKEK